LRMEPGVNLKFVQAGEAIPGGAKLVIIPGSKSTIADLEALRANGWDIDLAAHVRRGGSILGLCGGYQMLGRLIHDPDGLEGTPGTTAGLGFLSVETTLLREKTVTPTAATHVASGLPIVAYEIHLGKTTGDDCLRAFATTANGPDGAISPNGLVVGTYLHGCFSSDTFRSAFLTSLGAKTSNLAYEQKIDETLDALAKHLEACLDVDGLLRLASDVT